MVEKRCAHCRMRSYYDRKPGSLMGRMWKWHTGWCPGWKAYINSLPREEREKTLATYG